MSCEESHLEFYRRWSFLARPYFKWQFEQIKPFVGKRVADIGCGRGNLAQFFSNCELYLGFEPDEELRDDFITTFQEPTYRLAESGDILSEVALKQLQTEKVDTVISFNVLEHIKEDKIAAKNIIEGLQPGGHVCIIVPAHQWLFGTLDELDGHYRRYTKKSIRALFDHASLTEKTCYYFNAIAALGWYVKGRMTKEKKQADENYKMMNALIPVVSKIEKLIKPAFGLSVVYIAQKKV